MAFRASKMKGQSVISALCALGLAVGCSGAPDETLPEISPEESAYVVEAGTAATGELLRTLVGRLTAAMEEGGPTHAIEFCSSEALSLTENVQTGLGEGFHLKRTSFRYRNPLNEPDSAEVLALRYFEDAILAGGEPPSRFVQRVSETELRYYQPLFLGEFCLRCHGSPEQMDPAVLEKLEALYPTDLARGYQAGDFRGVVRMSLPAEGSNE